MKIVNSLALPTALMAVLVAVGPVCAATVVNGDFEDVQIPFASNNPADYVGWTHSGSVGDFELWSTGYSDGGGVAHAGSGRQFVTMGGGYQQAPGTTTWSNLVTGLSVGSWYNLAFMIAHEADFSGPQTVNVSIGGGPLSAFTTTNGDPTHYWNAWENEVLKFQALTASMTLDFSGTTSFDVGLDNVRVTSAVPLPAALPLFAGGLAGLGALGRWRKRRKMASKGA